MGNHDCNLGAIVASYISDKTFLMKIMELLIDTTAIKRFCFEHISILKLCR